MAFSVFRPLSCKAVGLSCITFCAGMLAGFALPIGAVAAAEAAMLVFVGYLCLFKW